tara:strand:+ start:1027 stop:2061 length:1035 start_codon:yes stop_codon:yes gene_type:complete
MTWLIWAILSAILWAIQSVSTFYFTNKQQLNSTAVNTLTRGIGVVCIIVYSLFTSKLGVIFRSIKKLFLQEPIITILSTIFLFLGNIYLYMAYSIMPYDVNAGLATGISNISIIISTLLAFLFLKGMVSFTQGSGIIVSFLSLFVASAGIHFIKKTTSSTKDGKEQNPDSQSTQAKKVHEQNQNTWITNSLISALFYGLGAFTTNMLTKKVANIHILAISTMIPLIELIIGLIVFILFRDDNISQKYQIKAYGLNNYSNNLAELITDKKYLLNGILNGLCEAIGLFCLVKSYKTAPNGGMSDAISGGYAVLQAPLLTLVFGTPISANVMLGLIGQVVGTMLMQK